MKKSPACINTCMVNKLIIFTGILLMFNCAPAQENNVSKKSCSVCRAVQKGHFGKLERYIKSQVRHYKEGIEYDNGPGSGMQISHAENLDSICEKLKRFDCVEDAAWDKCANKISIYPGWVVIGVKLNTGNGIVEKCFHIQVGTTGNVQFFKCRFHLFKERNILKYKKMYDCNGFIEEQRKLCED